MKVNHTKPYHISSLYLHLSITAISIHNATQLSCHFRKIATVSHFRLVLIPIIFFLQSKASSYYNLNLVTNECLFQSCPRYPGTWTTSCCTNYQTVMRLGQRRICVMWDQQVCCWRMSTNTFMATTPVWAPWLVVWLVKCPTLWLFMFTIHQVRDKTK